MKKFITEHPIFTTCLSTCLVLILVTIVGVVLIIVIIAKSFSTLSQDLALQDITSSQTRQYKYLTGNKESSNKILTIPIKGVILNDKNEADPLTAFFSPQVYGYTIKDQLAAAAKDTSIKGVILEINSPGGTITGSTAISDGIDYYKKQTNKPVLAHISGLGASGGYWVAASANKIMSDAGSLIGSIGVIIGPFKHYEKVIAESDFSGSVTTQGGIEYFNITGGIDKDFGDPYKRMSQRTINILQEGINEEYQTFVDHIRKNRNISENKVKAEIGALIYGNAQALKNGLIDQIGSRDKAYVEIVKMADLSDGDYQIVYEQEDYDFLKDLFKVALKSGTAPRGACKICGQLLYLYGSPTEYTK